MPDEQFRQDMARIKAAQDEKANALAAKDQAKKVRQKAAAEKRDAMANLRFTQGVEKAQLREDQQQEVLKMRQRHNREKFEVQFNQPAVC